MWVFDGHLDLAMNALSFERNLRRPVAWIREREGGAGVPDGRGRCTLSLEAMRDAGAILCLSTLLARCKPSVSAHRPMPRSHGDWPEPEMAHAIAQGQLAWYRVMEQLGEIRLINSARDLAAHRSAWAEGTETRRIGVILTMEGADPILEPEHLPQWHAQGLRTLLMTHFGQGRYAAGNPSSDPTNHLDVEGPLTERGRRLLEAMHQLQMPLDLTHLSDTSFQEAMAHFGGPVYASHSNTRHLAPHQRQLDDAMIRAIIGRGGAIGLVLHRDMIRLPPAPVQLSHLADHADHIAQLTGSIDGIAIGSDADGGFGQEACPADFQSYPDLLRLAENLNERGFSDTQVQRIFFENWYRFFERTLPAE